MLDCMFRKPRHFEVGTNLPTSIPAPEGKSIGLGNVETPKVDLWMPAINNRNFALSSVCERATPRTPDGFVDSTKTSCLSVKDASIIVYHGAVFLSAASIETCQIRGVSGVVPYDNRAHTGMRIFMLYVVIELVL
ncbi:hypothetical protein CSOJ01_06563 [Colletotrichum sojae]|uniref:Uncharacterized protein n=1 Tax=Colletotrichum sojae TaxID=2175907 RepID=A0A8H6JBK4_9PEZI|nr:hypothetical protein CSOJ01_06563 [Colletotrichum sojae]